MTKSACLAACAAALLCGLGAQTATARTIRSHGARQAAIHNSVAYADAGVYGTPRIPPGHLVDLTGDAYSGLGFYPLPRAYRAAAARYGAYRTATNPIRFAVASQAIETGYTFPAGNDYRFGVFNPNDGVGTPFFAGYYAD